MGLGAAPVRAGVLVRVARSVRIGPYVGAQVSWMPGLELNESVYPVSGYFPGHNMVWDVGDVQVWVDLGLRVVFML